MSEVERDTGDTSEMVEMMVVAVMMGGGDGGGDDEDGDGAGDDANGGCDGNDAIDGDVGYDAKKIHAGSAPVWILCEIICNRLVARISLQPRNSVNIGTCPSG